MSRRAFLTVGIAAGLAGAITVYSLSQSQKHEVVDDRALAGDPRELDDEQGPASNLLIARVADQSEPRNEYGLAMIVTERSARRVPEATEDHPLPRMMSEHKRNYSDAVQHLERMSGDIDSMSNAEFRARSELIEYIIAAFDDDAADIGRLIPVLEARLARLQSRADSLKSLRKELAASDPSLPAILTLDLCLHELTGSARQSDLQHIIRQLGHVRASLGDQADALSTALRIVVAANDVGLPAVPAPVESYSPRSVLDATEPVSNP